MEQKESTKAIQHTLFRRLVVPDTIGTLTEAKVTFLAESAASWTDVMGEGCLNPWSGFSVPDKRRCLVGDIRYCTGKVWARGLVEDGSGLGIDWDRSSTCCCLVCTGLSSSEGADSSDVPASPYWEYIQIRCNFRFLSFTVEQWYMYWKTLGYIYM